MAFVNEFVPEEDIEKYHLKEIMLTANPFATLKLSSELSDRFSI